MIVWRNQEAIASLDKALEIQPDYQDAWMAKGTVLRSLDRYGDAIACFAQAIEILPDDPSAWYNKACCHSLQNDLELAITNLTCAIELSPQKHRKMAKTDSDFDGIRQDPRFQSLMQRKDNS